ncbi:hypothetical protein [Klebsiella phage vB_KpnS-VAC35]|uniref:Uncharacterized protein n=2 Tax=Sugarlandvirus TaxID=2560233 RepID=A0A9E7SVY3_9CAUD|nr:hypothetical protein [Klebsiella phage vB_KpnS-VAC35]UTN90321.1 hypothetical protein [Klebsiella phage vB_KpnS_Uniso31]WOZ53461.1 hypothetical protein pKMKP103_CDS0012 [Klebsiella phage pKMKP103]
MTAKSLRPASMQTFDSSLYLSIGIAVPIFSNPSTPR